MNRLPNGKIASPYNLMVYRLEATGMLKDGEAKKLTIPEEENLSVANQKLVLLKPTAARTMRALGPDAAKDALWLLRTVADEGAIENGGYEAVRNEDGEYTQLEKPLTEHTVSEVLGLIQSGHTDFGIFGITGYGLTELIKDAKINLNAPFDKRTQNFLVLARLRQKANTGNRYISLSDQYRRLVNIDGDLHDQFEETVGDLPQYLQLETLLPAVATELVKQQLQ